MKVIFYSIREYEISSLKNANENKHELFFNSNKLTLETVSLSKGFNAVCVFIYDKVSDAILRQLLSFGITHILIRAAGYDNLDLMAAKKLKIKLANIPDYSPNAIAEHAVCLILTLNRNIKTALSQAKMNSYFIDRLIGFNLNNATVGIIGMGKIGKSICKILHGFDCIIYAYDLVEDIEMTVKYQVKYMSLNKLYQLSDIISIHVPLTDSTHHLIDEDAIVQMKKNVMIINTARGAVVNTLDIIKYLKNGKIGYYGADVIENEQDYFFASHKKKSVKKTSLDILNKMNNVIITPHQAFATWSSIKNIAKKVIDTLDCWKINEKSPNELYH